MRTTKDGDLERERNIIDGNNLEKGISDSDKRESFDFINHTCMRSLIDVLEWSTLSVDVIIQRFFSTRKTCCWRWWRRWRRCSLMRINIWKPKYFSSCSREQRKGFCWFAFLLLYAVVVCILFKRNFFILICVFRPTIYSSIICMLMHFVEAFGVGCHP